jgi:hypothetical protein
MGRETFAKTKQKQNNGDFKKVLTSFFLAGEVFDDVAIT